MSDTPPTRITILRHWNGNGFDVIAETALGEIQLCDGLAYDEMLGLVARVLCPVNGEGKPNRHVGRPLFLSAPKPQSNP